MSRSIQTKIIAGVIIMLAVNSARADQVKLDVALGHSVFKPDKKQIAYLKVSLTGFKIPSDRERTPVNMALVIDRSGSMQGEKILKAKEAAIMAVKRLTSRDIVSVVAYSDEAHVLLPATKLTDRESVYTILRSLTAGGSTALFSGVSVGTSELRKFFDRNRANRVILLSDGIANVGPSSPAELGNLGASLIREGISVSTIGLGMGYNEDLMSQLATKSDGNHYFAENATDLNRVFMSELGDVLSVVAQEVLIKIECAPGIRPVRALGREADITGQTVVATLNQLYSEQEKYILIEVEIPATPEGQTRSVAKVDISYANMRTRTADRLASSVSARFSSSVKEIEKGTNRRVMVSAVEQLATITNGEAVRLRDMGKISEACTLLLKNKDFCEINGVRYKSKKLKAFARIQKEDADNLDESKWLKRRKVMVDKQTADKLQRSTR